MSILGRTVQLNIPLFCFCFAVCVPQVLQRKRGIRKWKKGVGKGASLDGMESYDLPFGMNIIKKYRCFSYLPISPTFWATHGKASGRALVAGVQMKTRRPQYSRSSSCGLATVRHEPVVPCCVTGSNIYVCRSAFTFSTPELRQITGSFFLVGVIMSDTMSHLSFYLSPWEHLLMVMVTEFEVPALLWGQLWSLQWLLVFSPF